MSVGSWSRSRQASDGFWGASDNTKASSEGRRDLEDDGAVAVDDDHQERMDGCSRRIDSVRDHP